jgi:hypothetical protein
MYAETERNKQTAPNLVQDQNKRPQQKKNTIDTSLLQNNQVKPKHPLKNSPYQKHRDRKKNTHTNH